MRLTHLELIVKIVAAFASLVPFLASVESLKKTLDPTMAMLLYDTRLFLVVCFGIAYSATGDVRASAVALALAVVLFGVGVGRPLYGDFRLGYGTIVGMDVDSAIQRIQLISPSLVAEKREAFDPERVPNRIQVVHDKKNVVVGYKIA